MEYLAIHKLKDWRYENEWRLIYDAGSWYFGPEDVPEDFWTHGKSVPFIRPTRITMPMRFHEIPHRRFLLYRFIHKNSGSKIFYLLHPEEFEYGISIYHSFADMPKTSERQSRT